MSFWKSDFFVQFRAFYIKKFTRLKKVTNKLFISVWCVIIARRADIGRLAKWDSVGCGQCGGLLTKAINKLIFGNLE